MAASRTTGCQGRRGLSLRASVLALLIIPRVSCWAGSRQGLVNCPGA